jgi:hypothetical protein
MFPQTNIRACPRDFALIKTTPIGHRESGLERADLQFRSELFNLFNIVNMGLPANLIEGTGFGMISKTARTSRQIQFSLKLIFPARERSSLRLTVYYPILLCDRFPFLRRYGPIWSTS